MEEKQTRLEQARDWYLDAVDAIPADNWKGATLCAGWTPAHLVAHVATGDQLFRAMIMDATGKDRSGLDLPVPRWSKTSMSRVVSAGAIALARSPASGSAA